MDQNSDFLADGFERACAGIEEEGLRDVAREYADRLAIASFRERSALKREMKAEVSRRVAEELARRQISPDALY